MLKPAEFRLGATQCNRAPEFCSFFKCLAYYRKGSLIIAKEGTVARNPSGKGMVPDWVFLIYRKSCRVAHVRVSRLRSSSGARFFVA